MASRVEITREYARGYARASKKVKGQLLDEVVAVTGWTRDNARRRLHQAALRQSNVSRLDRRKQRGRKYSYDSIRVLQTVWAASGRQCGKYLAISMTDMLDALEAHGELVHGQGLYCDDVRGELEAMSPATIDRYLARTRAKDNGHELSTARGPAQVRTSGHVCSAGDEVEHEPGFFEGETVAHCGPTQKGAFARTVNLTDMLTGWVFTRAIRSNAYKSILEALDTAVDHVPYAVTGLAFGNGSEFVTHDVGKWAADKTIYFTRSDRNQRNDQVTIEPRNGHLVRRYAFYYRYDTGTELEVLNRMWPLVNDRLNFFTPTKKPAGWRDDRNGRRRRLYDKPATPYQRLLAAGVLSPDQQRELAAYKAGLNPAKLTRDIDDCQRLLIKLAADKTHQLSAAMQPVVPDTNRGVQLRAAS